VRHALLWLFAHSKHGKWNRLNDLYSYQKVFKKLKIRQTDAQKRFQSLEGHGVIKKRNAEKLFMHK
jgi:hypothetical protein